MKRLTAVFTLGLMFVLLEIHAIASTPPLQEGKKVTSQKPRSQQTPPVRPSRHPDAVFAEIKDDPKLPRVLLIGDSISMGYTLPVRRMLAGKANVHRIPVNGGDTARGLAQLDAWLGKKRWDVIHFNWGLHDLKRLKGGRYDARADRLRSPEEYARNLEALVVRLKKTGAALVWATTTPVPAGARGRIHRDEVIFNKAAAKIMKKHGVKVNDLYGTILPKLADTQRRNDVHFTTKGSEILGRKVVEAISAALRDRKKTGAADRLQR